VDSDEEIVQRSFASTAKRPMAVRRVLFGPGQLVPNPAFDLADDGEVGDVSSDENEAVIASGRRDQAVV
jgi:hypothetical protein